jgi:hypothetical protein
VLGEMLEAPTDSRLQPTPLPNTKCPSNWYFMSSMVPLRRRNGFYGGTSEIMKTIIARDVTGLRA